MGQDYKDCLCAVCLGLFALSVGVIGKLCSVIEALPGHLLYYLEKKKKKKKIEKVQRCREGLQDGLSATTKDWLYQI